MVIIRASQARDAGSIPVCRLSELLIDTIERLHSRGGNVVKISIGQPPMNDSGIIRRDDSGVSFVQREQSGRSGQ